jgi:hypothetical protein
MPSPAGWAEVPCARCGTRVAGIGFGEYCPTCAADREARARKLALTISLSGAVLVALYVLLFVPKFGLARVYGWIAVVATLMIARRVTLRVAREFLK